MLAGLLFATHDAEDRAGVLAATLPFGGVMLIEYQARLLAAAGAAQIIVVVTRLTPELLGALARIGRRGIAIDAVRTATEASAKLHPLARLLMLADGLVTTDAALAMLSGEGRDALLVVEESAAPASFERVGGRAAWAGIARLAPGRLGEVAQLPRDYDIQSALIHAAAQAGAAHVLLPAGDLRAGHGIERRGDALDTRGKAVIASTVAASRGWFERWVVGPPAQPLLAAMMRRSTPTVALAGIAAALSAGGLAAIPLGWWRTGLSLALGGVMTALAGGTLAWVRDERALRRWLGIAALAVSAIAVLLLAYDVDLGTGERIAAVIALALVAFAGLGERAASALPRRRWWGTPGAYLLVVAAATVAGFPVLGLGAAALYAGVTLGAAIERFRQA